MSDLSFLLNGDLVRLSDPDPTKTLLDWLREDRGLTGTKEGCNEGDCGACTVMVSDARGTRALNACILFLPQLHGRAVRTVEGVSAPDGRLHPVQQTMVDLHGSQCGFCTPGFIMSMVTAHKNGASDFDDQLAGNLCRCTGYAPIVRAAEAAATVPVPDWIEDDLSGLVVEPNSNHPESVDALADWYQANPTGTLIAGATDVGLWVTKQFRPLGPVAFLNRIPGLAEIAITDTDIRLGAMVNITDLGHLMAEHHPSFGEMIRRYGSTQVRNAATIGGNIANGSPIGDSPPALIALNARVHLRCGDQRRSLPLESFFIDYGKQDRAPGEFVEAVSIPRQPDRLRVYKVSKRFDQDISALCGAIAITVTAGKVTDARIAFGGMAGIPKRASAVETALIERPWNAETIGAAAAQMSTDFSPLSDMRASAAYRLKTAENMLWRYWHEDQGHQVSALEVIP